MVVKLKLRVGQILYPTVQVIVGIGNRKQVFTVISRTKVCYFALAVYVQRDEE